MNMALFSTMKVNVRKTSIIVSVEPSPILNGTEQGLISSTGDASIQRI